MPEKSLLDRALEIGVTLLDGFLNETQTPSTAVILNPTQERHTATHEAGHLITAWLCTHVDSVHVITNEKIIPDLAGFMRYSLTKINTDSLWADTVIALGGIAAEGIAFTKVQAKTAENDLNKALKLANEIASKDASTIVDIPWNVAPDLSKTDIGAMFHTRPSPVVCGILNACYRHARHIIKTRRAAFNRLVEAIITQRTLHTYQIELVLGPRLVYILLRYKRPVFLLPPP